MDESVRLFWTFYEQHRDVEVCIAELKRKGISQLETVRVLLEVSTLDVVRIDNLVTNSLVWHA